MTRALDEEMALRRRFGTVLHRVLADMLEVGALAWPTRQLLPWIAAHPAVRAAAPGQEGKFRARMCVSICVYRREFNLGERWTLIGTDVRAPASQIDLVWRRADGRVIADEIKSGALRAGAHHALVEQVGRILIDGAQVYGAPFAGVRAVLLAAPADARFYTRDGQPHPIPDADPAFDGNGRAQ